MAFLAFVYFAGPVAYQRATAPPPVVNGFTQEQVDTKVSAATANLNAQLTEATRQRDAAQQEANTLRQQQIQNVSPSQKIGPLKAIAMAESLARIPDRWAVFITFAPENREIRDLLWGIMRPRLSPWLMDAPDSSTDLDAPKFPPPPEEPGITFHGSNALNDQLQSVLSSCFVIRRTSKEMDGLKEWFNSRVSEPERNENRKITWMEIGHGAPWIRRDLTQCLQ